MDADVGRTCTIGPYPTRASLMFEPFVLLVACLFLTRKRPWADTAALLVSGLFTGYGIHFLLNDSAPQLPWMEADILHFAKQLFFALVVFCFSSLSVVRDAVAKLVRPIDVV